MLVCALSDIHANLPALEAILKKAGTPDIYLHCGDVVGYNAFPNECIEILQSLENFHSVLGNHDQAVLTGDFSPLNSLAASAGRWTLENLSERSRNYLHSLKISMQKNLNGRDSFTVHGSPRRPLSEYVGPDTPESELLRHLSGHDILMLGHTHVPMLRAFGERMVLNPGAVGQPRDGNPKASAMLLHIEKEAKGELVRAEYNIKKTKEKNLSAGLPEMLSTRLSSGF